MARPETRPLTAADIPLLAPEVERARAAGDFAASSDDAAAFFLKMAALEPRLVVAAFDDGAIVGFASAEAKVISVRPERRRAGIGRALVEAALGTERDRGRDAVILGVLPDDDAGKAFLAATGFAFHSTLWTLDLPRAVAAPAPVWPDGIRARPFDPARDTGPWIDLFNRAFADHATPLQLDASFIVPGFDDPAFAAADTELVEDEATGELVGFCATAPIREDGRVVEHAEIWTVGVDPERQGRGLGRQLLRWGVAYLRSLGVADVSLSVNGRNERALALYEAEGFSRTGTHERWARSTATRP